MIVNHKVKENLHYICQSVKIKVLKFYVNFLYYTFTITMDYFVKFHLVITIINIMVLNMHVGDEEHVDGAYVDGEDQRGACEQ